MSDPDVLVIHMQSRPEGWGLCYECEAGNHAACLGVPCGCPCPALSAAPVIEQRRYPAFGHGYEYRADRSAEAGSMACECPCPVPPTAQEKPATPPPPPAGEVETPTGGWTREWPTEAGWYWLFGWRPNFDPAPSLHTVEVLPTGIIHRWRWGGDYLWAQSGWVGWWCPLAPPSVEGLEP